MFLKDFTHNFQNISSIRKFKDYLTINGINSFAEIFQRTQPLVLKKVKRANKPVFFPENHLVTVFNVALKIVFKIVALGV